MASQNSTILITHIFTSRNIVLELMEKQGYNVSDYTKFSISEVNTMRQNNQLDMLLETNDNLVTNENPKRKIYIRYYLTARPAPKNIQEMIDDLFVLSETLQKTDTLFIIVRDDPNETLITELKHLWESEGIFIVIKSIKRLQFNILKNVAVPPHRIIFETETNQMINRYNITDKSQLPEISRFDPVALAIGLRPGQICAILRPSKTTITQQAYRICV
jgi:DNA-directed RNA polymerase subunit H (RpoH/RPB5)